MRGRGCGTDEFYVLPCLCAACPFVASHEEHHRGVQAQQRRRLLQQARTSKTAGRAMQALLLLWDTEYGQTRELGKEGPDNGGSYRFDCGWLTTLFEALI